MKWEHRCSLDWLRERQKYLTASDVCKLVPMTSTGRARKVTDDDYLKVMASKMVELDEEDCVSYGAAARGHLMEPFAITALNNMLVNLEGDKATTFYWWDDKIVSKGGHLVGCDDETPMTLAFSPDAANVSMSQFDSGKPITEIAEVKSYSPDHHLLTAYTPKRLIKERWQIAVAMATLPSIEVGRLVLFNPKMRERRLFMIEYDRDDLKDEITNVFAVWHRWQMFILTGPLTERPTSEGIWTKDTPTEERIAKVIEDRQRLNP